jgi:hypothetical protein
VSPSGYRILAGWNPSSRDVTGRRSGRLGIDRQRTHDNGRTRNSVRVGSHTTGRAAERPDYLLGLAWGR